MGGFAWVTLATNDSYSLGALVLANSLKQAGTTHQLVVLVTPGVTPSMRTKLSQVFNVVQEVNILDSQDKTNLKLLKRPELGITFTKLHCWRLTQYEKCVFLDADTLVLQNCDELFEREELSAAPDVGWPDCFNSGVFVYRPSDATYENLIEFALDKGSFDGGDQGLLNLYFSDWAHKDIGKHLPFIYNVCSTAFYSYLPAFKQYGKNAKIIHFIGNTKPWLLYFDSETKKVQPPSELQHITIILQRWWDIFCSQVHHNLSSEMAGLAGALAQMTLGVPRTAEQEALENHYRKQCWEMGNIDYLGKDSFDNIWEKICQTLSEGPAVGQEKPAEDPKPTPSAIKETEITEVAKSTEEAPTPQPAETKLEEKETTDSTPACPLTKPTDPQTDQPKLEEKQATEAPICPLTKPIELVDQPKSEEKKTVDIPLSQKETKLEETEASPLPKPTDPQVEQSKLEEKQTEATPLTKPAEPEVKQTSEASPITKPEEKQTEACPLPKPTDLQVEQPKLEEKQTEATPLTKPTEPEVKQTSEASPIIKPEEKQTEACPLPKPTDAKVEQPKPEEKQTEACPLPKPTDPQVEQPKPEEKQTEACPLTKPTDAKVEPPKEATPLTKPEEKQTEICPLTKPTDVQLEQPKPEVQQISEAKVEQPKPEEKQIEVGLSLKTTEESKPTEPQVEKSAPEVKAIPQSSETAPVKSATPETGDKVITTETKEVPPKQDVAPLKPAAASQPTAPIQAAELPTVVPEQPVNPTPPPRKSAGGNKKPTKKK